MTTDLIANRYKPVRTLGEGTMGLVSLVQDTAAGQEVALKVIAAKVGANEKTVLQFKQEFRLMTQLKHPNCCQVFDYGVTAADEPYFTMEVVPGHGLDELPKPMTPDEVKHILTELLLALGYLHTQGFVHRDIKAANVRVKPDGSVKLMDFGLMDYAGRAGAPISGTPAYMAPEVIKRGPIDQRSDLYAVGCLAYELLTGRLPFGGELGTLQAMQVLKAHMTDQARPPHEWVPEIPSDMSRMVMRLLAKEPLERFRSADEVLAAMGVPKGPGAGGKLLASPVMGREPELAMLTERLTALAAGQPGGAILLYGPSGMGKSRLIEEFRFAAQLAGTHYGLGALHEQGNTAYAPFVGALKALVPVLKADVPEELAKHGPVLVKLLPGLGYEPAPDIDPPSKEKLRLQSAMVEVLTALARRRPTAIVLEDWQWADPLSVEFLAYLVRNTRDEALMLVLTARPSDGDEGRLPEGFRRVLVGPLPEHGVKRMVSSMLGTTAVEASFIEKVASFSEGNPYHIQELLEHLVLDSTLVHEPGGWNTRVELTADRLPVNLKALLMRKFTYLSPRAQEVAKAGAVIGYSFDLDLLVDVTGLGDEDLFAAVEMLNLNLVFKVEEDTRYAFAQDQLQQMLYDYMTPEERKRVHAAVARALEKRVGATPLAEVPLEQITPIAHHYLQADVAEKVVAVALHAGTSAARLFALADAKRFLSAGLERLQAQGPDAQPATRFAYLRALGDVLRLIGEMDAAIPLYEEAIVLSESLGVDAATVAHMMTSLAKCHQLRANLDAALLWCGRSLASCEERGDAVGAARSLLTSCRVHYLAGNKDEMFAHTELGLARAKQAGDAFRIGEALAFLGYIYITSTPDKVDQGIKHLHESVAILSELGDKIGLQNCYNLLGNAQNIQGDFLPARRTFELNQKVCYEVGLRDDEIICYLNLAQCGLETGDFEEAAAAAQSAYSYSLLIQNKFNIGLALILEATAKSYLGEYKGAIALFDRALALALEVKNKYVESLVMQYKVETYLVLGHLGEAKAAAKRLIALIQETGDTSPESRMKAFLGEIVARQGDLMGGREYIQLAISSAMLSRAKGIQARALKVDAWISLQAGEWAEAKELALQALDVATAIGAKYLVAELEGILGEIGLATRASDPTEHWERMEDMARAMKSDLLLAQALFGQAATLGSPMRAVPLVKQAQDLLKALMVNLDDDSRICFANLRERNRILEGDFVNGFKPRARDLNIKVSLPGIKLGQNVWGLT